MSMNVYAVHDRDGMAGDFMQPLPSVDRNAFVEAMSGAVTGVTVVGQCTSAVVATSLSAGSDGSAAATAICEQAAPIAYAAQDVNTITVKASTGAELAVGIKGASCVASA